ncbi:hypothetical protein FDP41_006239 [Naegleria fowleri]|uniref:Myb-like domain-containing protein n=1 Tax=Naegleria fowleri TaxID=5763 RepID=A0A6A5BMH1_NAEFO|nr:uncharacterized protein FDP41_006239 [Naegleria fowleri]KAF0974765.1 hypothetical protein FDP41_006239 [Naegleria fowleri]CAG4712542.1 unnamed protein product [Naegleria fowleri]
MEAGNKQQQEGEQTNHVQQREDEEMVNIENDDDEEEEEDNDGHTGMDDDAAAQQHAHHLYQMQLQGAAGYIHHHGTDMSAATDPSMVSAGSAFVHPAYAQGMEAFYAGIPTSADYAMQQQYYLQQSMQMQRFIATLPPVQQQQYLAQMQASRNPQFMKYAAALSAQQKYGAGSSSSVPTSSSSSSGNGSSHQYANGSSDPTGGGGSATPTSPPSSPTTAENGSKKKRGKKNSSSATGSNLIDSGNGESKKGEKTRQRAVRHNWTKAQDDALMKAISSQQYSENGQKIRWTKISQEVFGSKLTPQSVYQRYMRVINPKLNHREWTIAEDKRLTELYHEMGDQWAQIAKKMNGVRADVWIRQRAVRLGLISEAAAAASASASTSSKPSKKRKDDEAEDDALEIEGETEGKKKKSKKKSSKKKKKKKASHDSDEEDSKINKAEDSSSEKRCGRRKNPNPRRGEVSIIFSPLSTQEIEVKQEDQEKNTVMTTSNHVVVEGNPRSKVFLQRKIRKKHAPKFNNLDAILNHTYDVMPQEKYISVSIRSSDIFRNFQPIPDHPLKVDCLLGLYFGTNEKNVCLSSYRTMVAEPEHIVQLDVSFPTNLVSFFSKCKLRRNTKSSLFLCVALRQAALVHAIDDDPNVHTIPLYWDKHNYGATVFSYHTIAGFLSGQYPLHLKTSTGIMLQSPLTINVKFLDKPDKLSDYPLELSKVHYRELSNHLNMSTNSQGIDTNIDHQEDIVQFMIYKANYINSHTRGVERLWLRWDMNCPLEDDFDSGNMMIMANTDEDSFAQLKKHLSEKHGDRFEIQFEGREGETGTYVISMNQYKNWYNQVQYMDRKRLMLLDPSTMDASQLTPVQKQFMDIWNNFLLDNYKLLMSDVDSFEACRALYISEKSKLDADEMKEILAHQFLRLTSLNVISPSQFMSLLDEAKIPLTAALQQQIQQIQHIQQVQQTMHYAQMQMVQQNMHVAAALEGQEEEEEDDEGEEEE